MNKNKFLLLVMLVMMLTTSFNVLANDYDRFTPSLTNSYLPLQVKIFDPTIGTFPLPKSPVHIPEVYIEGHALTFDESCDGCTLRIMNAENEVEYTTVITSSTLVLPSTLEGDYEIQIISGNYCFYGDIEL